MAPVIIEGPDASGKSTLAQYLSDKLGYVIKESEGPIRTRTELLDRLYRYKELGQKYAGAIIFVRHPLISEPIYGNHLRSHSHLSFGDAETLLRMMAPPPTIIYCDPPARPLDHQLKIFDTPEFLDALKLAEPAIKTEYHDWVYVGLSALYYKIGMDMEYIKCQVENLRAMQFR